MKKLNPLNRSFYARDTIQVAQDLLGCLVVRQWYQHQLIAKIVETEAYQSDDQACHAFRGKTISNAALFGPVGHAYIYFIYGNYFCMNAVARSDALHAGGVLIRALEPVEGIDYMHVGRPNVSITNLTNGPGKLTQALHITKALYGTDLTKEGPLFIVERQEPLHAKDIVQQKRIGISKEQDKLWRFYIANNHFVSKQ